MAVDSWARQALNRALLWTSTALNAVSRPVASKLGDWVSVKDFGAKGDNVNDDTTAIQNAINYMVSKNGVLYFPPGTYRISAALTIPFCTGWRIYGASRQSTSIVQYADNTRIFYLTGDLTRSWIIEELTLGWLNTQPFTNTNAIGIHMDNSAGTGGGYFNFQIRRITCNSGYRAISGAIAHQTPCWGARIIDCSFGGTLSGRNEQRNRHHQSWSQEVFSTHHQDMRQMDLL